MAEDTTRKMTRDEAVERVMTATRSWMIFEDGDLTLEPTKEMLRRSAEIQIESLVALNLLTLVEPAPDRSDPVNRGGVPPWSDMGRCEPPPEHRGKRWHWLELKQSADYPTPALWLRSMNQWSIAGTRYHSDAAFEHGWRYIAPCEEPKT